MDQFEAAGGYDADKRIAIVLTGLGFKQEQWNKTCNEFSGGWQACAAVLVLAPVALKRAAAVHVAAVVLLLLFTLVFTLLLLLLLPPLLLFLFRLLLLLPLLLPVAAAAAAAAAAELLPCMLSFGMSVT